MFSNTGDSSRPDPSTDGGVCPPSPRLPSSPLSPFQLPKPQLSPPKPNSNPLQVGGTFFNTSDAPTRAPINPNNNPGSGMFSNDSDAPQSETSAGYENNVEREGGEGKKKHGLLSKVKEAFVPKPGAIRRTGNEDLVSIFLFKG
jgi:hypothetical protein